MSQNAPRRRAPRFEQPVSTLPKPFRYSRPPRGQPQGRSPQPPQYGPRPTYASQVQVQEQAPIEQPTNYVQGRQSGHQPRTGALPRNRPGKSIEVQEYAATEPQTGPTRELWEISPTGQLVYFCSTILAVVGQFRDILVHRIGSDELYDPS